MTVHLKKLCVGISSLAELREWRVRMAQKYGHDQPTIHTTRHMPKRAAELLDGGSLYWVISGQIRCRQSIVELRQLDGDEKGPKCAIVMAPELVETRLQAHRPFQGWRYLPVDDAPADLKVGESNHDDLPPSLASELRTLGLI